MPTFLNTRVAGAVAFIACILLMALWAAFAVMLAKVHHASLSGVTVSRLIELLGELALIGCLMTFTVFGAALCAYWAWRQSQTIEAKLQKTAQALTKTQTLAKTDKATGLANLSAFEETLHERLATLDHDSDCALFLVIWLGDLEDRSLACGRSQFSLLIKILTARLLARLPKNTVFGTCDGRELRLLIEDRSLLPKLLDGLQDPVMFECQEFDIQAEFGFSQFPQDARSAQALLDQAWHDLLQRRCEHDRHDNTGGHGAHEGPTRLVPQIGFEAQTAMEQNGVTRVC